MFLFEGFKGSLNLNLNFYLDWGEPLAQRDTINRSLDIEAHLEKLPGKTPDSSLPYPLLQFCFLDILDSYKYVEGGLF